MLTLETKDYGTIEYEESDLIHFTDGLFGFNDLKDYIPLVLDENEDSTILLLQSIENTDIAFVIINPFTLDPDYNPVLSPEELSYLNVKSENDLSYYVICVLKNNHKENTVNMKAPIVINPDKRIGMQVILSQSEYGFRHKLSSFATVQEGLEVKASEE
ncbi:flagellar assembly protein FliW [Oribacterium sp. NK2B42]|uniref:flagellar assembly protein FliW n=1 Tax=Oribacterium sp. NK2B42 TaxID=689781 RepID=UPI0003FF88F2|nr:flagellar assembly protein FliW [Oribacterium sp. NK2B42]